MENTASKDLYDLLVTRDFDPELLDSMGKDVDDPAKAELFSFDWKTANKNYGTVVILMGPDNELEMYYGDNLGRAMEGDDKQQWYDFLEQMGDFSHRNLKTLKLNNLNKLKYTMKGMAAIKEGLFESYYGTRKVSYSDQPKKTRLMIRHNRDLGENEARYRAIDSLFVETESGERFRVPSRSLTHGRMLSRHISEGGTPYDAFGNHITEMINEMHTLAKFIRGTRGKELSEEAKALLDSAVRHYTDLKAKAKRIISQRGYKEERERYNPARFTDSEVTCEAIRDMFIERTVDPRVEQALPILARLAEEEQKMKEIQQFESWTNAVMEGTWALPDTPDQQKQLQDLYVKGLTVGSDAMNATEQLYDLVGDDRLFDILQDLAQRDPDANIWDDPAVIKRMQELGINLESPQEQPNDMEENLDVDGVMMTRPSNMSSESRDLSLDRLKMLSLGMV
jgi:hypothetical protein